MVRNPVTWSTLVAGTLLAVRLAAAESREEWQQPQRVVADLGLRAGARVADVGCGNGYFALRLSKVVGPAGKVFAVDPDAKALDALRSSVRRSGMANVEVIRSEPEKTRLADGACDAVLVCDVIHEVPEKHRAGLMKDTARAIRPGGFLFLLDYRKSRDVPFDPYDKLIPREDLIRLCTDEGLVLDAEFHYLKYQVFFRFRKPGPRPAG